QEAVQSRALALQEGGGYSPDIAHTTARLEAMMLGSSATPESISKATEIISSGLGLGDAPNIDPHENAGMHTPEHGARGLPERVSAATSSAGVPDHGAMSDYQAGAGGNAATTFGNADNTINRGFVDNSEKVRADFDSNAGNLVSR